MPHPRRGAVETNGVLREGRFVLDRQPARMEIEIGETRQNPRKPATRNISCPAGTKGELCATGRVAPIGVVPRQTCPLRGETPPLAHDQKDAPVSEKAEFDPIEALRLDDLGRHAVGARGARRPTRCDGDILTAGCGHVRYIEIVVFEPFAPRPVHSVALPSN